MHALAGTVRNGLGPSEHHFLFAGKGFWPGTV